MQKYNLWLYDRLNRIGYLESYESKIMVVAFVGTHIPLLALLFYFVNSSAFPLDTKLAILGVALVATLAGTLITLFILHSLLMPVKLTAQSLRLYWAERRIPDLPTRFTDDAGILMSNATEIIRKLDRLIVYLADYDNSTGLPNQTLFQKHLNKILTAATPHHLDVAVFVIHLSDLPTLHSLRDDRFSQQVLRAISYRLSQFCGEFGFVARLNGDEFAIAQSVSRSYSEAIQQAQRLLDVLLQPYQIERESIHLTACIGVALHSRGDRSEQVLSNACIALQQAKQQGNSCFQFHSTDMTLRLQQHLHLESELRQAMARNQLQLYYQPQIDLVSGHLVGVECLLRWYHPELGPVSPAEFIPIAEATGLILPIGDWVLKTACEQNRAWQQAGLPPIRMAINLSPLQFQQPHLVQQIQSILSKTGLDARYLELEVTESLAMNNVEQTLDLLQTLHRLGVTLALDDFGTGYSSLSYLRKFPFDILKIDRAFIKDVGSSSDAAALVKAIMALAGSLNLDLVAEGIETSTQLEFLATQGQNLSIQGYYFSPPVTASELGRLLKEQPKSVEQQQLSYSLK